MKKRVLGLYLSEHAAQVVLLEQDGTSVSVHAIAEWSNTLFNYAGDDTPGVDEFVDQLAQVLSSHTQIPHQVSVALDSALLFINTIPIEKNIERTKLDEHVQWELDEYFPGSPKGSFITDLHVLTGTNGNKQREALMVGVRRDMVQKLHRSLARLNVAVNIVDVDHFSADTAWRFNFPETANKFSALVGVKKNRLDISLIRYNDLISYYYHALESSDDLAAQVEKLSKEVKGLSTIAVYGTHLNREGLAQVRSVSAVPVEALNPFRSINIESSVRFNTDPTFASYRFAAAVGAALRRD